MAALRILLVQSDMQTAQPLARYFTQRNDEVWQAWELGQAFALIDQVKPSIIFMDLHYPGSEWMNFIRRVRKAYPHIRIAMTNKYPDLQREMMVREQDVQVFLRQPFSARWIEQAVGRLTEETQPVRARRGKTKKQAGVALPQVRAVRVPMQVKITLPYLVLALIFALAGAYVVSRMVVDSIQERFLNQLIEAGKQSTDWMVGEEDRLLATLRLLANTEGVAEALQRQDSEALRRMILPVAVNAREEAVEILDPGGISLLSLHLDAQAGEYTFSRGDSRYGQWPLVQRVARQEADSQGNKFAGLARAPWGDTLYVAGPVLNADGSLAGLVLVGKSMRTLVRALHDDTLGDVTIYDLAGRPLASSLFTNQDPTPISAEQVTQALQGQSTTARTRDLQVASLRYTEILAPWELRDGTDYGVMGVSLAQAFLVRTSQVTRIEIFALIGGSILLVLAIGLYLANRITRPLMQLAGASTRVAQGNWEIKVDASGDDEVAVLAQSFNYMVAGLQEGSIYRDLLGRTVSPEVRETLRQTFSSGNLRLEGQQALATVLMTDIRGFTSISEAVDAATVFQWLNEYFGQSVPLITAHGGVVNKFDGDAMLAFFGILPRMLSPKQSATAACQAALEVLEAIDGLNMQRRRRGEPPLITGIGINTGVVSAGGLGTSDRLHYTVIGDTVNTAQRIEGLTRDLMQTSGVLISQSTYAALGASAQRFCLEPQGAHQVKGKAEPITVYRLTGQVEPRKGS